MDDDEEAYYEEWEDYEDAIKEVVKCMREDTVHVSGIVFSGDFDGEWLQEAEEAEEDDQNDDYNEEVGTEEGEGRFSADEEREE